MKSSASVRRRAESSLPTPTELGLPPKYKRWREQQIEALEFTQYSRRRIKALAAPAGSGKTGCAWALAKLLLRDRPKARILILTETKNLQSIYEDEACEMPGVRTVSISGAGNYRCYALEPGGKYEYLTGQRNVRAFCDSAPCNSGMSCKLRDQGCTYYGSDGKLASAREAGIVITNYANWFAAADVASAADREEKFGNFDLLICDEGHALLNVLCDALNVTLEYKVVSRFLGFDTRQSFAKWVKYCQALAPLLDAELQHLQSELKAAKAIGGRVPARTLEDVREFQRTIRAAKRIADARGEWIAVTSAQKVEFKAVWPDQYAESHLLRGIEDVVIMSATLIEEDLKRIGLKRSQYDFLELPSSIDPARRPVYLFPCARMRYDMSDEEEQKCFDGMDLVLKCRPGWRTLIHTVSYGRMLKVGERSKHAHRITTHQNFQTGSVLKWFKEDSPPDAVVATPAMHTGVDLPDDQCRLQILLKVPFPDTRDPVVAARRQSMPKYLYYAAMKYTVQAAGRAQGRHETDYGEMWILDSNALWFFEQAKDFMPEYFRPAVKKVSGIGRAPKL